MSKEAMKLALEALELNNNEWKSLADSGDSGYWKAEEQVHYQLANEAIAALKALAEQPAQQEPVAWPCLIAEADFSENTVTLAMQCTDYKVSAGKHWLSNTPPAQRTWVGLTDEEVKEIWDAFVCSASGNIVRNIEAKLQEKNT